MKFRPVLAGVALALTATSAAYAADTPTPPAVSVDPFVSTVCTLASLAPVRTTDWSATAVAICNSSQIFTSLSTEMHWTPNPLVSPGVPPASTPGTSSGYGLQVATTRATTRQLGGFWVNVSIAYFNYPTAVMSSQVGTGCRITGTYQIECRANSTPSPDF